MIAARHSSALSATLLAAVVLLGCSAKDAPAAPTSFALTFPSTAAAVASDQVDVQVFAAPSLTSSDICQTLISNVTSAQAQPMTDADTSSISTCSVFLHGAGTLNVTVGPRAFLATTFHGGAPLLIGCAVEDVEGGQLLVPIDLSLISNAVSVPATTCTTLTDHCNNHC